MIVLDTSVNDLTAGSLNVACFTKGTMILTPTGEQSIETLRAGSKVISVDHGVRVIADIVKSTFSKDCLAKRPNLWPVKITANALGAGIPSRDLVVSPQHRILVRSAIARRMVGGEALVAAKKLLELPGVEQPAPDGEVSYIHLVLEDHEVVMADGAWSETFYPGEQSLKSLSRTALARLNTIMQDQVNARFTVVEGKKARNLVRRHVKNGVDIQAMPEPLVTTAPPQVAQRPASALTA